jgi:arginine deiminase
MNAQAGESNHVAIDIYTRAPGRLKYKQTTTNGSLVKFLQDRHIQIIPLSDEDEQHFGSNYLCIAPRHIMVTDGVSEDFKKKMEHYKVKVEYIKLDELTEGNGCAHCMTQVLVRQ